MSLCYLSHWTSLQAEAASASRFATPIHLFVLLLTKSGKSRGLFFQYNSCRTFIRPLANWRWNWDNRASWLTEKPTFEAYADYRSFPGEDHQEMVFKRRRSHMGIHSFPTILDPILNDFSESGADSLTGTIWEFQVWRLSLSRHKNKSGS